MKLNSFIEWMKNYGFGLTMFVFLIGIFFVFTYAHTFQHELIHQQLFEYDGCYNTVVDVRLWPTSEGVMGTTECLDSSYVMSEDYSFLHGLLEVASFFVGMITALLVLVGIWGLVFHAYKKSV